MPIYEARCKRCRVKFKYLCNIEHRDKPGNCPGCDGDETVPVMSATKTTFKHADRKAIK